MTSPFFDSEIAPSQRLIVALDVDTLDEAMELVRQLKPLNVTFKVGMELFYRTGLSTVRALQDDACLTFLDLKLHDIPNTVRRTSAELASQGVRFFNVHAQGGPEMMRAAAEGAREGAHKSGFPPPLVIAVTLLTSMSQPVLNDDMQIQSSLDDYVLHLARMTQQAGLDGVVCSAREAARLRDACGGDFVLVTPGIRPADYGTTDDQHRIVTPAQAMGDGAHFIVVGRPITRADDPVRAAQMILEEMNGVCSGAGQSG